VSSYAERLNGTTLLAFGAGARRVGRISFSNASVAGHARHASQRRSIQASVVCSSKVSGRSARVIAKSANSALIRWPHLILAASPLHNADITDAPNSPLKGKGAQLMGVVNVAYARGSYSAMRKASGSRRKRYLKQRGYSASKVAGGYPHRADCTLSGAYNCKLQGERAALVATPGRLIKSLIGDGRRISADPLRVGGRA
jgi:hypothetical protein